MSQKKKEYVYRWFFYLLALVILALGLVLNTKSGLGVSPIISVAYSASIILDKNFGDTTMVLYIIFVVVEMIIHSLRHAGKSVLVTDVLQIPFSVIFTRFMNLFSAILPEFPDETGFFPSPLPQRICVLLLGLICTGVGAAMSLNMRIIPNPGDGIVQAIADCIGKSVGFTKNCVDVVSVLISCTISLLATGALHGVGIGTFFAVILVGRTIAVFNHFTKAKLLQLAGLK